MRFARLSVPLTGRTPVHDPLAVHESASVVSHVRVTGWLGFGVSSLAFSVSVGADTAVTTNERVTEAPPAPMQVITNSLLRSVSAADTAEPERARIPVYSRFHAPLPTQAETFVAFHRSVVVLPTATLVAVAENSRVGSPSVFAAQTPLTKNNRKLRAILRCAILVHRAVTKLRYFIREARARRRQWTRN